jgi:hypothetical protein
MLMQEGYMPKTSETVRYICKQLNVPFDILLQQMDPAMRQQIAGQVQAPPRLKQSHTVNERVSRPGTTPRGNENVMMQSLAKMTTNAAPGGTAA